MEVVEVGVKVVRRLLEEPDTMELLKTAITLTFEE
jgi:hypothetical protein